METLLVVLIIWFCLVFLFVVWLSLGIRKCNIPEECPSKITFSGLSVIVPFKNESQRIGPLLTSIHHAHLPEKVEFLFVDDHSDDKTYSIISSSLSTPFTLLKNSGNGKKAAIRTGVRAATYDHILSLDADVKFSPDYFIELLQILGPDMIILPVIMQGGRGLGKLGNIEFSFLQLAGLGFAAWKKPVLCNGANLVFNRNKFLQVDSERTDYDMPSGDDIFLLSKFVEKKFCVRVATAKEFSVTTRGPDRIKELLSQRRRWIDKAGRMNFASLLIGASVIPFSQAAMIASLLFSFAFPVFLIPVVMKFIIELVADVVVVKKIWGTRILLLIIHQLWYPVYMFLLLIPVQNERWRVSGHSREKVDGKD